MAIKTTKDYYDSLANDNILFLQGTQADLNKFLPNSTDSTKRGKAIEGAFYLTTDTHRLYIGRKVSSTTGAPTGAAIGDVYPEEVSTGIATVQDAGELSDVTVAAEAHDGDFYYIASSNVLAVYRVNNGSGQWVLINAPTGINKIDTSVSRPSGNTTDAIITTEIETDAGPKTGKLKFTAGNNVQLTPGTTDLSDTNYDMGVMTISATDTTYKIGSEASLSNGNVQIGLKKNNNSSLETDKVTITGAETVNVTSDSSGNITVKGPKFNNLAFAGKTGTNNYGIEATLNYENGAGTASAATGSIDPLITYGQSGSKSTAHFQKAASSNDIVLDLDIYTKTQADNAIADAIDGKLATANAMTYKGTVVSAEDLRTKIVANHGAHNGDVYKVGAVNAAFSIPPGNDGVLVQTGDLIIISGTEETTGTYAGQITINGSPVSNSTSYDNILNMCELIPSGDEPLVTAAVLSTINGSNNASTGVRTTLYDGKKGTEDQTNILTTRYLNGNKIKVHSIAKTGENSDPSWVKGTGQDIALTFDHELTTRTDTTNEIVAAAGTSNAIIRKSTGTDTILNDGYELFVFSDPSKALTTDSYGHVTGLKGKTITFKHNKLNSSTLAYSTPLNTTNVGRIGLTVQDSLATAESKFDFTSSTLQVSGGVGTDSDHTNYISVDLKWGTFGTT